MRFVEQARNALILGPVGVGKTFMATALGHIACRRRISVHFERADKLHKRLKANGRSPVRLAGRQVCRDLSAFGRILRYRSDGVSLRPSVRFLMKTAPGPEIVSAA